MDIKRCPKCQNYSVSFDYSRGAEVCHWRDCGWVNTKKEELPVAHKTVITSRANRKRVTSSAMQEAPG